MAKDTLPPRVDTVIRWNACGKELEFTRSVGKEDTANEGALSAVMGKIVWLQTHVPGESCKLRVRYFFADARWLVVDSDLINDQFHKVFDPNSPAFGQEDPNGLRVCQPLVTGRPSPVFEGGDLTAFDFDLEVGWACMRLQVNVALMKAKKGNQNLGTENLPCGLFKDPGPTTPSETNNPVPPAIWAETGQGDWDVVIRDLLRIVYLDRNGSNTLLDATTRQHILFKLVTVGGPMEESSYSLFECGNQEEDTGSPQERADEIAWTDDDGFWSDLGNLFDWIWNRILIFGPVAAGVFFVTFFPYQWIIPVVLGAGVGASIIGGMLRIPESENHLFMINTSRYLMNQHLIGELPDEDDREKLEDSQKGVKNWLLKRLQRVTKEDFREYNSRPYQRYTIYAILNLHDFSKDDDLKKASEIVLDFAAAKFAAGSNQGRRVAPFRRLMDAVPRDFLGQRPRRMFDMIDGADHQIAAMLLFAGQTQQLPDQKASIDSATAMIYEASSTYRPDEIILEIATNKTLPYEQSFHHDGFEIYSSGAGYLISAGGIQTGLANEAIIGPIEFTPPKGTLELDKDRGTALPTVLIPGTAPHQASVTTDFLRIEGFKEVYPKIKPKVDNVETPAWTQDHNLCVRNGFACGVNIVVPPAIDHTGCLTTAPNAPNQWRFIDSDSCHAYQGAPHFYVVLFRQPCIPNVTPSCPGNNWGFFEVVDSPSIPFEQFKQQVIDANPPALTVGLHSTAPTAAGNYVSARNEHITFSVRGHQQYGESNGIISYGNHTLGDISSWPLATGLIDSSVPGKMTIQHPALPGRSIKIDFSDWESPKREVN